VRQLTGGFRGGLFVAGLFLGLSGLVALLVGRKA